MEQKQSDALEQFCILAKGAKGKACEALIEQALAHPQIYFFGELLEIPSVKELINTPSYRTLLLFAFGNIDQYQNNKQDYITLNENQLKKLKQLTLVQEANRQKVLLYRREIEQNQLPEIRNKLVSWVDKLKNVESIIQTQIKNGIEQKELQNRENQLLQKQISEITDNILKSLSQGENPSMGMGGMGMSQKRKKGEDPRGAMQFLGGGGFQTGFMRK